MNLRVRRITTLSLGLCTLVLLVIGWLAFHYYYWRVVPVGPLVVIGPGFSGRSSRVLPGTMVTVTRRKEHCWIRRTAPGGWNTADVGVSHPLDAMALREFRYWQGFIVVRDQPPAR